MRVLPCVGRVWARAVLLACVLGCATASAGELYRLRLDVENRTGARGIRLATVYLDNLTYPLPAGVDPNAALRTVHGVFFGVEIPSTYDVVSYDVGSAVTQVLQGQIPFLHSIESVPGGLTFALIFDDQRLLGIPAGFTQPIFTVALRSNQVGPGLGFGLGPFIGSLLSPTSKVPPEIRLVDTLAMPVVPIALHIAGGALIRPATRDARVLGGLAGASAGPGFPPPTSGELDVVPLVDSAGGFDGNHPNSGTPCDIDLPLTGELDWDVTVCGNPGGLCPSITCSPGPAVYPTINAALQAFLAIPPGLRPSIYTIRVMPGVYNENLYLDMMEYGFLRIYSVGGPDCTIIDGGGIGPCVEVVRTGLFGGTLWFGTSATEDRADWRGFTLRGGAAVRGAGISLTDQTHQLRIVGNVIGDPAAPNVAEEAGGGIYILGGNHAWIALNEIRDNIVLGTSGTSYRGAGVAFDPDLTKGATRLTMQNNEIHGNHFDGTSETPTGAPRQGGGVYVNADALYENTYVRICSNHIYENIAVQGAGAFLRARSSGDRVIAAIVDNEINLNRRWQPFVSVATNEGYQGGGLYLNMRDRSRVLVIHNQIYRNNVFVEDGLPTVVPAQPPHRVGGGLYAVAALGANDEEHSLAITGNFVYDNTAAFNGAGGYFAFFDDSFSGDAQTRFHTNTVTGNRLLGAGAFPAQRGSGVYFAAALPSVPAGTFGAAFQASSNIVWGNEPPMPTGVLDAYAEALAPGTGPFRFSHIDALGTGVAPLFGPACANADPVVVGRFTDPHIANDSSPCVDTGDPLLTVADLLSDTDIDGDNRFIDIPVIGISVLDRGADEFAGYEFIRGVVNPNSSGTISISDVVIILGFLFSQGSLQCLDAADVNDDGAINLFDPIYLLDYYYLGGPLPPAPYFSCGPDVTLDSLGCVSFPLCP